eukprot:1855276-Alexandrium_andersonii.AAC.1
MSFSRARGTLARVGASPQGPSRAGFGRLGSGRRGRATFCAPGATPRTPVGKLEPPPSTPRIR